MVKGARLFLAVVASAIFFSLGIYALETRINKLVYNNNGLDTYSFEFETSDGTYRREDGGLKSSPDSEGMVVRGEYGYIDRTGKRYVVRYIADHNGYQPLTDFDEIDTSSTEFHNRAYSPTCHCSEDVELRRLFPSEFPQDTVLKSGMLDPGHLGRYNELKHYFRYPKARLNSHFEELACYEKHGKKVCEIDQERYTPEENSYYSSTNKESHVDRRRVYCILLLCFTEGELDRIVSAF